MENIHLNAPYKIIPSKHKRYTAHYEIPGAEVVIVEKKKYGDQIACEAFWKAENGAIKHKTDLVFDRTYLEPLDAIKDFLLYGIWEEANRDTLLHLS